MTDDMYKQMAPLPTIRRLPRYLQLLLTMQADGREFVSTTHIADALGLEPIQVRKDLGHTGIVGKPKVGFELSGLIERIEAFLGWNNTTDAFLIGAGHLGSAVLGYEGFGRYGLNIIAAFDNDPTRIGTQVHGRPVFAMDKLRDLATRMHITMAIMTVPRVVAQEVADELVAAGFLAIWNFTAAHLKVPAEVVVQNEDLSVGLAVLSVRLASAQRQTTEGLSGENDDDTLAEATLDEDDV